MFSFDGEFRRKPQQSLGGASRKATREELLYIAQKERNQREEKRKIQQSATTIQAFVRGSLWRQSWKKKLRSEFDANAKIFDQTSVMQNADLINEHISKLLQFYSKDQDRDRLLVINQLFLRDKNGITCLFFLRPDRWLYKIQKLLHINVLYLKNCVNPKSNIALALRFLEVYTTFEMYDPGSVDIPNSSNPDPAFNYKVMIKIWDFLIKRNYFETLRLVLDSNVPDSIINSPRPPTPLAGTLLDLFTRPLNLHSDRKPFFMQTLFQEVFMEELSPQVLCFLLPAFSCQTNIVSIDAILTGLNPDNLPYSFHVTPSLVHAFVYLMSKQARSLSQQQTVEYLVCFQNLIQSISDWKRTTEIQNCSEDETMEVDDGDFEFRLQHDVVKMINDIDHVNVILTVLENHDAFDRCISAVCCLCYLLLCRRKLAIHHYRLLYSLAFKPPFFRLLWKSILSASSPSTFGSSSSLLSMINQGLSFSTREQSTFLPQLTVFCSLLNHLLSTLHDFEFYDQNSEKDAVKMMPFTLPELASICGILKDLCMGLIELAYPDRKTACNPSYLSAIRSVGSRSAEYTESTPMNSSQWNWLFKVVILLLRQLYSRDCRHKFCPEGTWVAPQFPIFFEKAAEMYFAKREGYGFKPFAGVQLLTREQLAEGPPPSAVEVRQLALLREFPFAVRFHDRFKIFHQMILKDKDDFQGEMANFNMGPLVRITVRRNYIYEDASTALSMESEPNIKIRILVQLINSAGLEEVGIDGGGLFREFLQELLTTCFDPNRGLFKTTHDGLLYPNPAVVKVFPDFAAHFFFVGRMLGKAIYESMLVELPLAAFFLTKILSRHSSSDVDVHHLASLDPVMYRNLLYLKTYEGDVTDLGLDFTVMNSEFGENEIIELIPGGANIPVNESNFINYIHLMADYKLNKQIKAQCQAFKEGLANVIDMEWLYMFDPNELQILISGAQAPIDITDLRAHTVYTGGYSASHPTIVMFWRVVEGFEERQKKQLLKFVTSCSHAPLLGFKELVPAFCIQNSGREVRLPTASTCMNLLKLPEFESEDVLKVKLSYAIESGAGFELS